METSSKKQTGLMRHFSALAGPFQKLPQNQTYRVQFRRLTSYDNFVYRNWTRVLSVLTLFLAVVFAAVLFQPKHWIIIQQPESPVYIANFVMLICLIMLQINILVGVISATRSTLLAQNPIPVRAPKGLRVAFVTTRAPGEPIELVKNTLKAAKKVRYTQGTVDVWLLDETNDPELIRLCESLHVKHFSRQGVPAWNTQKPVSIRFGRLRRLLRLGNKQQTPAESPNPFFAAKTKHGNFNSWQEHLKNRGISYDLLAGVDTDHVPEPNYLERTLGYFRDENIAYVVGPQVYGNYGSGLGRLVCRWAESQASFFQGTIQRAGNASRSPMFVGTNYVIRFSALKQIGGFQPCITEDMATGLAIHATRNPITGKKWRSVYTPDVLAIGEGPTVWGSFFTQQWRWAAGTFDTWRRVVWRIFWRIPLRSLAHYFLMLTYYPIAALTWLLAVISSVLYLLTGATAVLAPWGQFASLYLMGLVMQLSLYFWNRRYNVSPHEPAGSYGVAGMAISALTAPVYFSALMGILRGKKPGFVVTKKGGNENLDHLLAFKSHYMWAGLLLVSGVYGFTQNHDHPAMVVWVGGLMIICLLPVLLAISLHISTSVKSFVSMKKSSVKQESTNA